LATKRHKSHKGKLATEDKDWRGFIATKRHKKHRFVNNTVILSEREESPKHLNILKQKSTKNGQKVPDTFNSLF